MKPLLAFLACLVLSGCSPDGAEDGAGGADGDDGDSGSGASSSDSSGAGQDCEGPLGAPQDPESLPACCAEVGGAHCVDSVPEDLQSFAAACDGGGYCVPDEFISTGGVYTPPSCTSVQGSAGVCLSACIPKVAEVAAILPQDSCAAHEKCVPCVSPIDGTETGACKLGFSCDASGTGAGPACDDPSTCVYDCATPAIDLDTLDPCPDGCGGHCLEEGLVPEEQKSQLGPCDDGKLCVPDDLLEMGGKLIPETCESIAGFEGRCLSDCLPEVAGQAAMLPKSSCVTGQLCVPCYDPIDGSATGACSLSCDAGPKEPAQTLPECCNGVGTCVPTASLPPDQASSFGQDACPAAQGLSCVPDVLLSGPYVPIQCKPSNLIFLFTGQQVGACMKKCMPSVASAPYVEQGACASDELCIPCFDQGGLPTGACETTAPCAHDACETGGPLTWGCDANGCVTAVCKEDPFCCTDSWDEQCAGEVETICLSSCP